MLQLFVRIRLRAVPPLRHSPPRKLKKNSEMIKKKKKRRDVSAPCGVPGELFLFVSLPEFREGR